MYKAIVTFKDLKDDSYTYHPGDKYPRDGFTPSQERIEQLSTKKNRRGIPVIEEVKTKKEDQAEEPKAEIEEPKEEPAEEPVKEKTEAPKPKRERKKKNAD